MFTVQDKAKLKTGSIRSLHLAAVKLSTIQETKLLL
jgi:hypothetical protein